MCYNFTAMMLHEAGHILGLNHPDKIHTQMMTTATPTDVPHRVEPPPLGTLRATCGPNPWALMVRGVPDSAELDPRMTQPHLRHHFATHQSA